MNKILDKEQFLLTNWMYMYISRKYSLCIVPQYVSKIKIKCIIKQLVFCHSVYGAGTVYISGALEVHLWFLMGFVFLDL